MTTTDLKRKMSTMAPVSELEALWSKTRGLEKERDNLKAALDTAHQEVHKIKGELTMWSSMAQQRDGERETMMRQTELLKQMIEAERHSKTPLCGSKSRFVICCCMCIFTCTAD